MVPLSIVDRYRKPEYTGENRCLACTVVNAMFALLIGMIAFVGLLTLDRSLWLAFAVEVAILVVCGVQIWLRGYLLPRTPTLTKRYLPGRVLRWFGKDPTPGAAEAAVEVSRRDRRVGEADPESGAPAGTDSELDVEGLLRELGALRPAESREDFELAETFGKDWHREIESIGEKPLSAVITSVFAVEGDVSVQETSGAVRVYRDDRLLAQWESRPALVADLAACRVLAERADAWARLSAAERSQLAGGLRLYLDRCPACAGRTAFDTETTTSCCHEYEVATVSCVDCGTRLFELPVDAVSETDGTV
ncbi:hypothetical protein [Halorhabdus rudnickae]|uniref:hypothetical protein n=1 Tax=Halorhabdus rudnickae TaxID=1775544 RepID=UPI00108284E7|nr:hypothetical protein [Halorhabdus rudnickae]